jgi:hypothetical protein
LLVLTWLRHGVTHEYGLLALLDMTSYLDGNCLLILLHIC